MAGALALGNAESLVGLVLTQLVRPGAPFLYGMNVAALDMQATIVAYGAPDWAQAMAAFSDIARFYKLPVWGGAGASDSKVVDAQAGFEATTTIMSAFISRCNVVHDVGYIEYGSTSSMELLVICDEIIRHTRFIVGGVEVSERTLAREAIDRARPGGGFFADDHTLENWKTANGGRGRRPEAVRQLAEAGEPGHGHPSERMDGASWTSTRFRLCPRQPRPRLQMCCHAGRKKRRDGG